MGFDNAEWQVQQKSINSFQSLYLAEGKHIHWDSPNLRRLIEQLLQRSLDSNQTVSKASQQVYSSYLPHRLLYK